MLKLRRKRKPSFKQGERPYRDWHDLWTLAVETLGFAAVIVTIIITLRSNASNNADMTNALSDMRDIAAAMSNEAEAISAERPLIEKQAGAAADSAEAAKDTATTAKRQTEAIVRQASALIKGAEATGKAANAELASAQAQLTAANALSNNAVPIVRFAGLTFYNLDSTPDKLGVVKFKVNPFFQNNSTVPITPKLTVFHMLFAAKLPPRPEPRNTLYFGGNDIAVPVGLAYGPEPLEMTVPVSMRDELIAKKLRIFVWGKATFVGPHGGEPIPKCFAAEVGIKDSKADNLTIHVITDAAYQCPDKD